MNQKLNKDVLITTPIYYVNDKPHIGSAYTTLVCDSVSRMLKLKGHNVYFMTGTDEHGQKVEKAALNTGKEPQVFVDEVSQHFRDLVNHMQITPSRFIRTTEPDHAKAAQTLWKAIKDNGHIYLGSYDGWYALRDEAFYAEDELVDGKAPTGAEVEWVSEPSYFFKLSEFQDKLLEHIKNNLDFIQPTSKRNEVVRFIEGGLKDLSISRTTFKWGIPVAEDPKHVMYVWLDALTNYLTALGYPNIEGENFQKFWPHCIHFIGKDILRFHAVYWPAFLMAAGLDVPQHVYAHGWWTNEGQKISKSLGNTIDPIALIDEFGIDAVRYYLLREVPLGNDGNFSKASLIGRLNSDLANSYGNLVRRITSFIHVHCQGMVPQHSEFSEQEIALFQTGLELGQKANIFNITHFIDDINQYVHHLNKYVDEMAPWKLKNTNRELMEHILYVALEAIKRITILYLPFIPIAAEKVLDALNIDENHQLYENIGVNLKSGNSIKEIDVLFQKKI